MLLLKLALEPSDALLHIVQSGVVPSSQPPFHAGNPTDQHHCQSDFDQRLPLFAGMQIAWHVAA
jgi:hypothetical protein